MTERDAIAAAARGATALRELAHAVADAEERAWRAEQRAREAEEQLAEKTAPPAIRAAYRRGYAAGHIAAVKGKEATPEGVSHGRPRKAA